MNTRLEGPELSVAITLIDLAAITAITLVVAVIGAVAVHFKDYPKYRRTWKALADNAMTLDRTVSHSEVLVFNTEDVKAVMRRVIRGDIPIADYMSVRDQGSVRYYPVMGSISLVGGGVMVKDLVGILDPYHLLWRVRLTRLAARLASAEDPRAGCKLSPLNNTI